MIRVFLLMLIVLISSALGGAMQFQNGDYPAQLHPLALTVPSDPLNATGSSYAFNYSYSQANLYTGSANPPLIFPAANTTAGTQFKWLNTVTDTTDGSSVLMSGFRFNITSSTTPGRQVINWTLTIPELNCKGCSSIDVIFDLFGNLVKGTNTTYTLSLAPPNSTTVIPPPSGVPDQFLTPGGFPQSNLATLEPGCPEMFCIPVTQYVGYTAILSFNFGWNASGVSGMSADVGEIEVASIGNIAPSCTLTSCHFMQQDPLNASSIIHTTRISSITYNNTLTTRLRPGNTNVTRQWWNIEVVSIYYSAGYELAQIKLNNTLVYPTAPETPLEIERCFPPGGAVCSQSLIALNMTDFSKTSVNSTITIISKTANSISQVSTLSGGVANQFFTSGDEISIKVVNRPSIVNASTSLQTGTLTITFPSALSIQTLPLTTATGGVYNFTLPSSCGPFGQLCATKAPWTFSAVFTSGFDLGNATGSFRMDLLQVESLSETGGDNSIAVQGKVVYGNGTAASRINATLFAIDLGTPVNTPVTSFNRTQSADLYISNASLVDGVFTQSQSLLMMFTVVNPSATQAYNATVTIAHDWPGPQGHNMSVTFPLGLGDGLGDFAFTNATARTFEAKISFTGNGPQVVVTSLFTGNPTRPLNMTRGTSPVLPNTPHAGLFNITIASRINNQTQSSRNSILSPPYAYVPRSFTPSRYLYGSLAFQTGSDGSFSERISSSMLLGAKNLTVFLLARDAFGIVVANSLPSQVFSESTSLISTADPLGPVTKDESATATLRLKSTSTTITMVITVNLIIQGNGVSAQPRATQTGIIIGPGDTVVVQLTFTAPSNVGNYNLAFSSPEYGGVLTSQTLQVTILQSNLQLLIPAAIGVVAAIIVLGFYLIRRRPSEEEGEETTKPKGPSPKPRNPPSGNAPTKSLTQTKDSDK